MNDSTPSRARMARFGGVVGLLAAGAIGGAVLASAAGANAASTTASTTAPSTSISAPNTDTGSGSTRPAYPAHGSAAHEALEKPVTGTNADKAKAAAVQAVGGTAGAVTTDVSGSGYEVTVTKADGSQTEVHLDQSFAVDNPGR